MTYRGLDVSRVQRQFQKVVRAIEENDFRTPDVKKLSLDPYYRARLDDTNRLLLTFIRYGPETVCLALDVIHQHAYDKCRFLRGARIDEDRLPDLTPAQATQEATPVRYLHPQRAEFHLLDKVISFDDAQEEVYRLPPPVILVGSAGSGKTALTLQKLREMPGQVLYVTLSSYLAQNAQHLYAAYGFQNAAQEVQFLSFGEFLKTVRVPEGREVSFGTFREWFGRQPGARFTDAHQLFEEFRGVLSSAPGGPLTREQYLGLGTRQSIFAAEQRPAAYDLFGRYRAWMADAGLHDSSELSAAYLGTLEARFDFVVVDEVQDLTAAQLALVLRALRVPGQFLLCGDSNQIVHPNFFSWASVKRLLWQDPDLGERQKISVLRTNFRNAAAVTRVANDLLRIKHARFGSVDRESNFLVESVAGDLGSVTVLPDDPRITRQLDEQTGESTDYAVIVLRDEDKAAARRIFRTPLVFSVHEAKGLEYRNIILYDLIGAQRQRYAEIARGVTPDDLNGHELRYGRARDKDDKSLEIYKFYVNALYVAVTRAVERVILVEREPGHPLLGLLRVPLGDQAERLPVRRASRDDWEREARRLELQGKKEQAGDIRRRVLREQPVPWEVWTPEALRRMERDVQARPGDVKHARSLLDYAVLNRQDDLLGALRDLKIKPAAAFLRNAPRDRQVQRQAVLDKYRKSYEGTNVKAALQDCDRYGVDHRSAENLTPLMLAALAGNLPLIGQLIARGADPEQTDLFGRTPYILALGRALESAAYAREILRPVAELTRPGALDILVGDRLVRLGVHSAEYHFLSVMLALWPGLTSVLGDTPPSAAELQKRQTGFYVDLLRTHLDDLPTSIVPEARRRRTYFNHVLGRAEVDSGYQPARQLWKRVRHGFYMLNPELRVGLKTGAEVEWVSALLLPDPVARAWLADPAADTFSAVPGSLHRATA